MCFQIDYRMLFFVKYLLELSIPQDCLEKLLSVFTRSHVETRGTWHVSALETSLLPSIRFQVFCSETWVPHFPETTKGCHQTWYAYLDQTISKMFPEEMGRTWAWNNIWKPSSVLVTSQIHCKHQFDPLPNYLFEKWRLSYVELDSNRVDIEYNPRTSLNNICSSVLDEDLIKWFGSKTFLSIRQKQSMDIH